MNRLQSWRQASQMAFFLLFLSAPALDLLRFDVQQTQLWFLGMRWSLGIDALMRGEVGGTEAALSLVARAFVPGLLFIGIFLGIAYHYGRLYCGWLCPHFSVVERLNKMLHRACGKFSVWERHTTPLEGVKPHRGWWPLFALSCLLMGALWAITLLTYLLPPGLIWGGLVRGQLSDRQGLFLLVATVLFSLEFAFARHLFCRFGCAVGLFQSLAWMANPRALVISFAQEHSRECKTCDAASSLPLPDQGNACDRACPMRLKPRGQKRMMFSCVQCGQCLQACEKSQQAQGRTPNLQWRIDEAAVRKALKSARRPASEADKGAH